VLWVALASWSLARIFGYDDQIVPSCLPAIAVAQTRLAYDAAGFTHVDIGK